MFEQIKEKLQEIIEIAENCPEKYQDKCFEILLKALIAQTELQLSPTSLIKRPSSPLVQSVSRPLTLPEFREKIKPKSGVEYVVLCGYWLENYAEKLDGFTSADIRECFKQLRYTIKNPSDAIYRANKRGFLMAKEENLYLLSQKGLQFVQKRLGGENE